MKRPAIPPKYSTEKLAEILSAGKGGPDFWVNMLEATKASATKGKYIHWDKLRHLTPPDGMTHENWWMALKFQRSTFKKIIDFVDTSGLNFSFIVPDRMHESLRQIDMRASGTMAGAKSMPGHSESKKYLIRSLIEEAITSSQLEGATTTRSVAKKMIKERRKPKTKHEQMIINNYYTLEQIRELKSQDLDKETVCDIHQRVTLGTLDSDDEAGRFRQSDEKNYVSDNGTGECLHTHPPAEELDWRIERMCDFANGNEPKYYVHPVLRAIILHFWLAYDHPFVDGNGRCARALFYWCMLRNGYWATEYLSISHYIKRAPAKYRMAYLHTETDDADLTYFLFWHLEIFLKALEDLDKYMEKKIRETNRLADGLLKMRELNYRQRELIAHALRSPGQKYTVSSHKNSHGVTRQTAQKDLVGLENRGLLESSFVGKYRNFYAVDDMVKRLEKQHNN